MSAVHTASVGLPRCAAQSEHKQAHLSIFSSFHNDLLSSFCLDTFSGVSQRSSRISDTYFGTRVSFFELLPLRKFRQHQLPSPPPANMRVSRPSFNPGRTKNLIHGVQGFIIFLAWALTIAVFTKGDGIDGRSAWYWALVSLSP